MSPGRSPTSRRAARGDQMVAPAQRRDLHAHVPQCTREARDEGRPRSLPSDDHLGRAGARARIFDRPAFERLEDARDVEALSAVLEECLDCEGEVVGDERTLEQKRLEAAEPTAEFLEGRDQERLATHGSEGALADETRGRRGHAFDRLCAERGLFDVNSRCQVLGHVSPVQRSDRRSMRVRRPSTTVLETGPGVSCSGR